MQSIIYSLVAQNRSQTGCFQDMLVDRSIGTREDSEFSRSAVDNVLRAQKSIGPTRFAHLQVESVITTSTYTCFDVYLPL